VLFVCFPCSVATLGEAAFATLPPVDSRAATNAASSSHAAAAEEAANAQVRSAFCAFCVSLCCQCALSVARSMVLLACMGQCLLPVSSLEQTACTHVDCNISRRPASLPLDTCVWHLRTCVHTRALMGLSAGGPMAGQKQDP
jgi:hypothetical protein